MTCKRVPILVKRNTGKFSCLYYLWKIFLYPKYVKHPTTHEEGITHMKEYDFGSHSMELFGFFLFFFMCFYTLFYLLFISFVILWVKLSIFIAILFICLHNNCKRIGFILFTVVHFFYFHHTFVVCS